MMLPFAALLLAIALGPFLNRWWEKYYFVVSFGLAAITIGYYLSLNQSERLVETSYEYISFICLIGSLYVVAGGIHINVPGQATPLTNVIMLAIGAVIANIVGTTGASMILIRPYLRLNRGRVRPHHIVFFIFVVSNIGGALTPIGDPPLFLGYLQGIPFFWITTRVVLPWITTIAIVLTVFYIIDWWHIHKFPIRYRHKPDETVSSGSEGVQNILFVGVILGAVFLDSPLREIVMMGSALTSLFSTRRRVYQKNDFKFRPITEVAILFFGIFATMIPALEWLECNACELGICTPGQFFWATGSLSSVLDNAPTYLNFLVTATGLLVNQETITQVQTILSSAAPPTIVSGEVQLMLATINKYYAGESLSFDQLQVIYLLALYPAHVIAISVGAVFFGAMTYIGNGPNLMVKSIAEAAGVKCPSFLSYILKYSLLILIPVYLVVWLWF
ncbi:MAG: sodium:proton antiporter [Candidatus Buchananbacteria bacterium]|nr:sodium:proton antiporter [Candidatus Buchananbacteria bacterium]